MSEFRKGENMATLRDFVTEKKIKCRNQNGQWVQIDFSNNGYSGNQGPELSEVFYNIDKHFDYSGDKVIHWQTTWEKIHDDPNLLPAFYPIISTALDISDGAAVQGALHLIGENYWWDTAMSVGRDDIVSGGLGNYKLTSHMQCSAGVFYKNEYDFEQYFDNENNYVREGFDEIVSEGYAPQYNRHWYIPDGYANEVYYRSFCPPPFITGNVRVGDQRFYNIFDGFSSNIYTEQSPCMEEVDTNVPVIIWDYTWYTTHASDVNSAMHSYLSDGDLSRFATYVTNGKCVISNGYQQPTTEGVKQFNCYCDVYEGDWGYAGVEDEEFVEFRYLQLFIKPSLTAPKARATLIKEPTSSELRARIKIYGDIEKVRYSTDGGNTWTESNSLPWEYLFYKRTNEIGSLKYDQNHGGNMLLFASEALSDDGADYLADDYGEKSQYYPATNESGTAESSTLMGSTTLNSFFQRLYIVDKADMAVISSALYDTGSGGIWEDIKQGIEMFGENPIDCVAGLCYFPFDLTSVFSGASAASSVWFGGYQLQNVNVYELMDFNGYVDIGTMEIKESFPHGSYRNYEPYTSIKIFLPFIGLKELKLNKYIGKTMAVRYYFDCFNGGCTAVIFADGLIADYFDGMAGVQIPITLTDFAGYAAAQIGNFTELGASMASAAAPLAGGANVSSLVGAGASVGSFEKALFKASQTTTSDFNSTKGASSSMINQYLPNYVFVIFEIIEEDETPYLTELMGKPSNKSGTLGSFSGYLEIDDIILKSSSGMTKNEANEFISLLHNGIII